MSKPADENRPRIIVRLRPPSPAERGQLCVQCHGPEAGHLCFTGQEGPKSIFDFDRVFDQLSTQAEVYEDVAAPLVAAALLGDNCTIITYGQTGSGKSHTLIGAPGASHADGQGVVPRTVKALFAGIAASQEACTFAVSLSAAEIYCERIRCLLDVNADNLSVHGDRLRGIVLQGATHVPASSEAQLMEALEGGLANRVVASTAMNAGSSRSHCVLYLHIQRSYLGIGDVRHSKICLVDLAGSERQDKTAAEGLTAEEAKQINKSLSALGLVVSALTAGKGAHVPYRDSKLTRVLQDSLGGSARTALIVCCSPCSENAAETLSSLRFGARAGGIMNVSQMKVSSAEDTAAANLEAALAECRKLREELKALQRAPMTARSGFEQKWMGYPRSRVVLAALQSVLLMLYFIMEDIIL